MGDREYREERLKQIYEYEKELHSMPPEEPQQLLEAEREKENKELEEKAAAEERARFYNQPSADADFDHWSRAIYWRLRGVNCIVIWEEP